MKSKKLWAVLLLMVVLATVLCGCRQAERVTYNVQKEADNFNVERRLTVINARTDKPMLELVGYFSLSNNSTNELQITIQTGPSEYRVDYVYLNEWTLYTVEDITGAHVNSFHYELNFLPEMIQPFVITSND